MINLHDYARNKRPKEKTEVLAARLPASAVKEFKELCGDLGMTVSEAVYLMVEDQLALKSGDVNENCLQKKFSDNKLLTNSLDDDKIVNKRVNKIVNKRKQPTGEKRFTVNNWKVDGEIPCPICKEWTNFSNFARHSKQRHEGMSTKEIFTNEEYVHIANEMLEKKANK